MRPRCLLLRAPTASLLVHVLQYTGYVDLREREFAAFSQRVGLGR